MNTKPINRTIRVGVVEDHDLTRVGITSILKQQPDFQVLWETSSGEATLAAFALDAPDILLMDINLPDTTGIKLSKTLLEQRPHTKILIISMYDYSSYVRESLEAGVKGYLLKNECGKDLVRAIQVIMDGGVFVCNDIMESIVKSRAPQAQSVPLPVEILTDREKKIVQMVAREYSNREIADKLCLGVKTVENYKSTLFQKLGVKNSIGLVRYAFENRLV